MTGNHINFLYSFCVFLIMHLIADWLITGDREFRYRHNFRTYEFWSSNTFYTLLMFSIPTYNWVIFLIALIHMYANTGFVLSGYESLYPVRNSPVSGIAMVIRNQVATIAPVFFLLSYVNNLLSLKYILLAIGALLIFPSLNVWFERLKRNYKERSYYDSKWKSIPKT